MRMKRALVAGVAVLAAALVGCVPESGEPRPDATPGLSAPPPPPTETPADPPREPTPAAAITIHPAATEAAMGVLADGGTAADAAFAAAGVLSVVEPYYSNLIGGETSALFYDAETGDVRSLEAVGTVGSEFDLDRYRGRGPATFGLHQALVPGAWDGWIEMLRAEGALGLDRLLEPAIALARDGHEATPALEAQLRSSLQEGAVNDPAMGVYAPGGAPVRAGSTVVQSDFAATLQGIADVYAAAPDREAGIAAAGEHVYTGELGQRLLDAARAGGASFTADDMAAYSASIDEPLSFDYEGHTVYQTPPTSQGLAMLVALNILSGAGLAPENADAPETAHTLIEAVKLALADREAYMGDPAFTEVPVDELLDPAYGERQLARIDQGSSLSWPIAPGLDGNTTTMQVVDHDGDAITVTTSTGYNFVAAGDTGVMLNNRMRYMTADDPGSPNFLEPGKRVRYTGNPYLVTDGDGLRLLGGSVGGDAQAQIEAQQVVSVLSFGLGAPEATARPRFISYAHPNSIAPHYVSNQVVIEDTTPQAVIDGLRQRGQNLSVEATTPTRFGYSTMIEVSEGGARLSLGIDPRTEASTGEVREAPGG